MAIQRLDTDGELAPELLFERHFDEIRAFLADDVPANLFQLCWLENHGVRPTTNPELFAFRGIRDRAGRLRAVSLLITDRLLLIDAVRPETARHFGRWFRQKERRFEHVVSAAARVEPFWEGYQGSAGSEEEPWVEARLNRRQTMYVLERSQWLDRSTPSREPTEIRPATLADLDPLFFASARMHREETLEDPLEKDPESFREHVRHRVETDRSYVWFGPYRRLMFKADISARGSYGAQISGVYTSPQMRGEGIATRGMHDICQRLFADGIPRIVLYVNCDNAPAKRVYEKVGFQYHTDYQTVFIADP